MISSPGPDVGFGFLLGTEYERRKQKLQQELQLDYTRHVSQKKLVKTGEAPSAAEALSLPIDDNTSEKEKLREERNKEYNLFLQTRAQTRKSRRRSSPSCTVQHSSTLDLWGDASPPSLSGRPPHPEEPPPSRRDAATLTESVGLGNHSQTWVPCRRQRRRWHLDRPREAGCSEEELDLEEEDQFDFRGRTRRERPPGEPPPGERPPGEPPPGERPPGERAPGERAPGEPPPGERPPGEPPPGESPPGERPPGERPPEDWRRQECVKRAPRHIKEIDSHTAPEQNSNDRILESDLQTTSHMRMTPASAPPVSQQKPEVVTGLMIGSNEEQTAAQKRKEQYKQELLKQIAEQKRNQIKEKSLELRVAATGATDPEKDPDRMKHFGVVNWQHDRGRQDVAHNPRRHLEADGRAPNPKLTDEKPNKTSGASHVDPGAGRTRERRGLPSPHSFSKDYHKDFSSMLGEMAVSRVAAFDPLIPPSVPETCKTPHDAAYYYYGARNLVEPHLPYNQSRLLPSDGPCGGEGQSGDVVSPSQRTPRLKSRFHLESTPEYGASPLAVTELHQDKQRRVSPQSYQEALRQQIKEREEHRKREEVKVEAEVLPYDPWGRGGCGAPITDPSGGILCDLKKMRRFNEEPSRNHAVSPTTAPPSHQSPGFRKAPNKYMEALKEQMQVNRRKQEEERERIRTEEEDEEKRLAVQRAFILQEYEQEKQREQQRIELCRLQKQNSTIQHKRPPRREKQSEEVLQRMEDKQPQLASKREASPLIPTLQKKRTDIVESRVPSVESQLSDRTESFVSAPQQRANSAGAPQTQECQQEVIRVLWDLRRHLSKEQKQLELQLGRRSPEAPPYSAPSRRWVQSDTLEVAHRKAAERRDGRPLRATTYMNKDNIRDFTQLKYRDTDSREEVRAMFPDPPTDDKTLDIQQQVLLRQQQRKIRRMNQQQQHDFLDDEQVHPYPSSEHGNPLHTDRSLPSHTNFIEFYGGDGYEEEASAERGDTAAKRDERSDSVDTQSLQSATRLNSCEARAPDRQRAPAQEGDHYNTTGGRKRAAGGSIHIVQPTLDRQRSESIQFGRNEEFLEPHEGRPRDDGGLDVSALERPVSMETIATEPWLRPGSSQSSLLAEPGVPISCSQRMRHCT